MTTAPDRQTKPNLLFVSRDFPTQTGGGSPMRAGMTLRALAEDFNVYLIAAPRRRDPDLEKISASLTSLCGGVTFRGAEHAPLRRAAEIINPLDHEVADPRNVYQRCSRPGWIDDWSGCFPGVRFAAVHVMRIYLAPFVKRLLLAKSCERPACTLDLDDYESKTRARFADLCEKIGADAGAVLYRLESEKYVTLERSYMPLFDSVYVCSELDRQEILSQRLAGNVAVLPNAVPVSERALAPHQEGGRFTFLFVGSMDYFPNEEAVLYFVREVLPLLRRRTARPFRVLIAGRRPGPAVQHLASEPEVTVEGWAPEVTPWYAQADAVIAPIRAGGGTRVKILEAFSYQKPVIATPLAAEGLPVGHGRELWIAEGRRQFAERCLGVLERPEEACRIAANGFRWVKACGSFTSFQQALRDGLCTSPESFSNPKLYAEGQA